VTGSKYKSVPGLAVSLGLILSGCATSGSVAVPPQLPDVPPPLRQFCVDPGVPDIDSVDQAISSIADNRVYAACERRKHRDLLTHVDNVRAKLWEGIGGR
jgi:hypothetical protein